MAPEVFASNEFYNAEKADIFSLGILFYLMIFRDLPFSYPKNYKNVSNFLK